MKTKIHGEGGFDENILVGQSLPTPKQRTSIETVNPLVYLELDYEGEGEGGGNERRPALVDLVPALKEKGGFFWKSKIGPWTKKVKKRCSVLQKRRDAKEKTKVAVGRMNCKAIEGKKLRKIND